MDRDDSLRSRSPLDGWGLGAVFWRFVVTFLFGLMVDGVVFGVLVCGTTLRGQTEAPPDWLWVLLIAIPLIWGGLGVFFYRRMLELGRRIVEEVFDV